MWLVLLIVLKSTWTNGDSNVTRASLDPWKGSISNSRPDNIRLYPYQVAIEEKSRYVGGGSIISLNYVISSAECVKHGLVNGIYVRAGTNFGHFQGSIRKISKIIVHEDFGYTKYDTPRNNIALVHVSQRFTFDKTCQPIAWIHPSISKIHVQPDDLAVLSGYSWNGDNSRNVVRFNTVQIPIVDTIFCNYTYKMSKGGGILSGQMCAGYYGVYEPHKPCYGDSGSPLAAKGFLVGIVSWANGCQKPHKPAVYTEVAHYHDWIIKNVGNLQPVARNASQISLGKTLNSTTVL